MDSSSGLSEQQVSMGYGYGGYSAQQHEHMSQDQWIQQTGMDVDQGGDTTLTDDAYGLPGQGQAGPTPSDFGAHVYGGGGAMMEQHMMQQQMMLMTMGYNHQQPYYQHPTMYDNGPDQQGGDSSGGRDPLGPPSARPPTGPRSKSQIVSDDAQKPLQVNHAVPPMLAKNGKHPLRPRNMVWKAPIASTPVTKVAIPVLPSSNAVASSSHRPSPPPNALPPPHKRIPLFKPEPSSTPISDRLQRLPLPPDKDPQGRLYTTPAVVAEAETSALARELVSWAERVDRPEGGLDAVLASIDREQVPHAKTVELVECFMHLASGLDWSREVKVDDTMRTIARKVRLSPLVIKVVYEKWRSARFCIGYGAPYGSEGTATSEGLESQAVATSEKRTGTEELIRLRKRALEAKAARSRAIDGTGIESKGERRRISPDLDAPATAPDTANPTESGRPTLVSTAAPNQQGSKSDPIDLSSDEEMEVEALLDEEPTAGDMTGQPQPPPAPTPASVSGPSKPIDGPARPSASRSTSQVSTVAQPSVNDKIRARLEALKKKSQSPQPDSPTLVTNSTDAPQPDQSARSAPTSPLLLESVQLPSMPADARPSKGVRQPADLSPSVPTLSSPPSDVLHSTISLPLPLPLPAPPPPPSAPPPNIAPPPPDASIASPTSAAPPSHRGSKPPPSTSPPPSSSNSRVDAPLRPKGTRSTHLPHLAAVPTSAPPSTTTARIVYKPDSGTTSTFSLPPRQSGRQPSLPPSAPAAQLRPTPSLLSRLSAPVPASATAPVPAPPRPTPPTSPKAGRRSAPTSPRAARATPSLATVLNHGHARAEAEAAVGRSRVARQQQQKPAGPVVTMAEKMLAKEEKILPEGWVTKVSKTTGRPWYYHPERKESSWVWPTA